MKNADEVASIAKDILFESYQITIMPPPDVPKGKRGPKPDPAASMVGWAASNICDKHGLGAAGAWDNSDTGERSTAADIYDLVFHHTKMHIDPDYRGRHHDTRHGLERGKSIEVTTHIEDGKIVE